MIRKDASNSKKLARLSPRALALFGMLIAHYDAYGKMNGDPMYIKSEVVPLITWFTLSIIRKTLAEIDRETNVKWFQHEGRKYLHSLNWDEHQDIRKDRRGKDVLPSYVGEVPDKSGSSPGAVRPEVKRSKEKLRAAASVGDFGPPRTAALPTKDQSRGNGGDADQVIPPELKEWGERLAVTVKTKQEALGIDPEEEG